MNDDNDPVRRTVEHCYRTSKTMINPIVEWTDDDVWQFLRHYGCEGNPLYQCGFSRIGCIGCPMASGKGQKAEFARWPKYRENYVKAFDRMLVARTAAGRSNGSWRDGEAVMRWWVGDDPNQICIDDLMAEGGQA